MITEAQHKQINRVLRRCERYWRENEVPDDKAQEMRDELEHHLYEAAADGKSAEEVVGPDPEAFAEGWAAPNRRVLPLRHEVLELVSDALAVLAAIAVLAHLLLWSPAIPVSWKSIAYAVSLSLILARAFAYFQNPSGSAPGSEESIWDRLPKPVQRIIVVLMLASVGAYVYLPLPEAPLFGWIWPATVATLAAAAFVRGSRRLIPHREAEELTHRGRPRQDGAQQPPQEIEEALLDCELRWRTKRIPDHEIAQMRADLEQHLREAAADGRWPGDVVGPDTREFAEDWAERYGATAEELPLESLTHRVQGWIFWTAIFFALAATLFHVLDWSASVPIVWFPMLLLLGLGSALFGRIIETLKRPGKRRWPRSWAVICGAVLLLTGLSVGLALFVGWGQKVTTFEWPWQATVASAAVACGIVFYGIKTADRQRRE